MIRLLPLALALLLGSALAMGRGNLTGLTAADFCGAPDAVVSIEDQDMNAVQTVIEADFRTQLQRFGTLSAEPARDCQANASYILQANKVSGGYVYHSTLSLTLTEVTASVNGKTVGLFGPTIYRVFDIGFAKDEATVQTVARQAAQAAFAEFLDDWKSTH